MIVSSFILARFLIEGKTNKNLRDMKNFNVKKMVKNLRDYVYTYVYKHNGYAFVMPNQIVVFCNSGYIQIWDNDRHYTQRLYNDSRGYAFHRILEVIAGWYEDDLDQKVYRRESFVLPNGFTIPTTDLDVPFDEEGYPAIGSGEMYRHLVQKYGCGDMIWSEEEASQKFNNALSELTQESIEKHHLN